MLILIIILFIIYYFYYQKKVESFNLSKPIPDLVNYDLKDSNNKIVKQTFNLAIGKRKNIRRTRYKCEMQYISS